MQKLFAFKGFSAYLLVVFINAFVDLGHKIVVQNTVFKIYDGQTQIILTAILNALILLPFILLFSPSGYLSDKYPKPQIMRVSAIVAVIATSLITICYWQGWFVPAFIMTLIMGIQSALYSPAKYGYVKELLGVSLLAKGNAVVQAVTIVSILSGTLVFSGLFEWLLAAQATPEAGAVDEASILQSVVVLAWVFVLLSLLEWYFARQLPITTTRDDSQKLELKRYLKGGYLRDNLKLIRSKHSIWLAILGLSMFWSVSQVMLATFPAFAKDVLNETNTFVIQGIMACTGVGIVIGSVLSANASKNYIELGFVPIAALSFATLLVSITLLDTAHSMAIVFLLLGISGGLFIIPLNALMQYHVGDNQLGRVLAGNNWVQNVAMLSGLLLTISVVSIGIEAVDVFYFLTTIIIIGTLYIVYRLPQTLIRIVTSASHFRYQRIDVIGLDLLPRSAGVLLLGHSLSWYKMLLLQSACPRPIRFVVSSSSMHSWPIKLLQKLLSISTIREGYSKQVWASVNHTLQHGGVVCLVADIVAGEGNSKNIRFIEEKLEFPLKPVIVALGDTAMITPFSLMDFAKNHNTSVRPKLVKQNMIKVTFGKPLALSDDVDTLIHSLERLH
ncbi:MFS transporter [Thalassotalea maritima]|uniref:MFS transporter n=1 Tax=Thalassotalea maritima TaxID=3242416 RepID=UPI00352801EE